MVLSFGPYKGRDLGDVPKFYLDLLASQDLSPVLHEAVGAEIARRRVRSRQRGGRSKNRCWCCLAAPSWPHCRGCWCCRPDD